MNREKSTLRTCYDDHTKTLFRISPENKLEKMAHTLRKGYDWVEVSPEEIREVAKANFSQALFRMINDNSEILEIKEVEDVDFVQLAREKTKEKLANYAFSEESFMPGA